MTYTGERELRFLVSIAEAERVIASARGALARDVHDRKRPVAYSRTTYLDTDDFLFLRSCAGPVATRVRVRQYAAAATLAEIPTATPNAYLELKASSSDARGKVRIAARAESLAQLLCGRLDDPWLRRRLDRKPAFRDVERWLERGVLRPRLTTWYRRRSFSGDGVRVTIDHDVRFCRPLLPVGAGLEAAPAASVARVARAVLEVKLAGRAPRWLSSVTSRLRAAPHFSKYRVGMDALGTSIDALRRVQGVRTFGVPSLHKEGGGTAPLAHLPLARTVLGPSNIESTTEESRTCSESVG